MTASQQILYAFGAGRDPQTKAARRLDRFSDRTFRIGSDVIVRPGRRVPVTVGYLSNHLDEVLGHIERGALRLQSDSDSFIDKDELRAIVAGQPLPEKVVVRPPAFDVTEAKYVPPPAPATLPAPPEPDPVVEATADAPPAASEESSDAELAGGPEAQLELAEEPVDALQEPEATPVLPEGWRTRSKKGLLALAQELKLEVSDKMSNREIITALEALEK